MDEVVFRRARHVIGEIERTVHAAEGVRASNWPTVGQLMYASHASLRDDYEVSCKELDAVVEIAEGIGIKGGVYGCRMTGGGFGGCTVALVKSRCRQAISKKIAADYKKKTGIEATIFVSRPAAGATVIKGGNAGNPPVRVSQQRQSVGGDLIAQAGSHAPGGFHPRMIRRNDFAFAGDFFQRHRFRAVAARGHHHAENILRGSNPRTRCRAAWPAAGPPATACRRAGRSREWSRAIRGG